MTKDETKSFLMKHRLALWVGGVTGLALLFARVGYEVAMTPTQPIIATASAAEVVRFISNDRGLGQMPQIEQEKFLQEWRQHILQEAPKEALKSCLKTLDKKQRKQFSAACMRHLKRAFLEDARRFARSDQEEKYKFVRRKIKEYAEEGAFMKDVTANSGFGGDFSTRPDDIQQWVLEHTTAQERAVGEPYVDALKNIREQVRKERRSKTAADAAAPSQPLAMKPGE